MSVADRVSAKTDSAARRRRRLLLDGRDLAARVGLTHPAAHRRRSRAGRGSRCLSVGEVLALDDSSPPPGPVARLPHDRQSDSNRARRALSSCTPVRCTPVAVAGEPRAAISSSRHRPRRVRRPRGRRSPQGRGSLCRPHQRDHLRPAGPAAVLARWRATIDALRGAAPAGGRAGLMRLVVGMSGASGVIYGIRLLEVLPGLARRRDPPHHEPGGPPDDRARDATGTRPRSTSWPTWCTGSATSRAAPSSGSFRLDAMVVVPCSMKTLAAIAYSLSDNLLDAGGRRRAEGASPPDRGAAGDPAAPRSPSDHGPAGRDGRGDSPADAGLLPPSRDRRRHRQPDRRPPPGPPRADSP